jgi:hypothetical protein
MSEYLFCKPAIPLAVLRCPHCASQIDGLDRVSLRGL